MTTYRDKDKIPLRVAKLYLYNDFKALSKIQNFYVKFDGWPISINGKENDDYTFLGHCRVKESSIPDLLSALEHNEKDTLELDLIFKKGTKDGGIFPKEFEEKFTLPIEICGNVKTKDIKVYMEDIDAIVERWYLPCNDEILDKEIPKLTKQESKKEVRNPDVTEANNYNEKHLGVQVDVLGAAFAMAVVMPKKCLNEKGNITASHIFELLEEHAHLFWPKTKKLPLKSRTITGLMYGNLKKLTNIPEVEDQAYRDINKIIIADIAKEGRVKKLAKFADDDSEDDKT